MDPAHASIELEQIGAAVERAHGELHGLMDQIEALRATIAEAPPAPDPAPPVPVPEPSPAPPLPDPTPQPVPDIPPVPDPNPAPQPPVIPEPSPPPIPEPTPPPIPEPSPPPQEIPPVVAEASSNGEAGTRLVAMKMAIDGSSREQIEAELAGKFGATDRAALLDEVFARAGR